MNPHELGKRGLWILIALLAVSGVSMALIVVFGLFDSIAYSLVWRVFVADLYLVASLAAQHTWLRRSIWVGTGVTFVLGLVSAFWEYTPYAEEWADHVYGPVVGVRSSGWSPWHGFEADLEYAAHLAVCGLVLLGVLSFAYRWVARDRVLRAIYTVTFVLSGIALLLGVALILDSPWRWDLTEGWGRTEAALSILAFTGAAILIIAAILQRNAQRSERRPQEIPDTDKAAAAALAAAVGGDTAGAADEELRSLVRQYVDEYLNERER